MDLLGGRRVATPVVFNGQHTKKGGVMALLFQNVKSDAVTEDKVA